MNPVMSSWVALRAAQVIAAGRNRAHPAELDALGADQTCTLDEVAIAADVDVVLDYLWGEPTVAAMAAMLPARADHDSLLTWIQIGSVAGDDAAIPSAALRSTRLQIIGSGIGSVPARDFAKALAAIAHAVTDGEFDIRTRAVSLTNVEHTWTSDAADRIVFVP